MKIHHPTKTEVQDQTGLVLAGRHSDGRYQYRSLSVLHHRNIVALTHAERVGLALCRKIAAAVRGRRVRVYPMTRESGHAGYGTYGADQLWLMRPLLRALGEHFLAGEHPPPVVASEHSCLGVLAHEMGHNTQPYNSKPHGPEFKAAEARAVAGIRSVLSRGWPKLDMRKLRDSTAPHLAKKKAKAQRRKAAACETRTAKWARALRQAEGNLENWQRKLAAAERRVAKHQKAVRHAQLHLRRATEAESQ